MPGDSSMDELIHKMLCSAARCRIDAEYVLKRRGRRGRLGIDHPAHRIDDRGKGNAPRQEGRDRHLVRGVELRRPGAALGDRGAAQRSGEHTSELQSLMRTSYAVFCLTKNNNTKIP